MHVFCQANEYGFLKSWLRRVTGQAPVTGQNALLGSRGRMVGNPEVIPPIFRNQVLAPLPRVAPASQINFSGLPLNITAGLRVIRPESKASAEITCYKPTSQELGIMFACFVVR